MTITPVTEHDKKEWSRMATDCYAAGINYMGTRYSVAATLRIGEHMSLAVFDALQINYRQWLIGGAEQFRA